MNAPSGRLAENVTTFVRALRAAGLPVGTGAALTAVAAVRAGSLERRDDVRAALSAVLVARREEIVVFEQVFDLFWRRRGFLDEAAGAPAGPRGEAEPAKPRPGAARVASVMFTAEPAPDVSEPSIERDARQAVSDLESLRTRDFAQMSAFELAEADAAIARLTLPGDRRVTRRLAPDPSGRVLDPRASFRRSLRAGGGGIALARRAPTAKPPPVVAICDVSGSMSDYTRVFLHFLHALSGRRRVNSFLFGTRLTDVTRALRAKDIDEALADCSAAVPDWSGGTRIAQSLHSFNKHWARRVLGQGAILLLFTDGLERGDPADLAAEMGRVKRFSRRVIWVNPLLRFGGFEAKALGIRTMLPFVDEFRPIHNLAAIADLCAALSRPGRGDADPKRWLRRAA